MNATDKQPGSPPQKVYNPVAEVFEALRVADRPTNIYQLSKALPKLPQGTLSGSLFRLKQSGAVERNAGTRPALWRAVKKELPAEFMHSRLRQPVKAGVQRNRVGAAPRKSVGKELLIVVPLGKRESATMSESEARALLASLRRMFGE